MNNIINITRSSLPTFEEYIDEIRELWESRWLSNRGVKHIKFEQELQEYLQSSYLALFANGHVALELSLSALKISGEVITTPFTHVSTTHSIVRNNLKPVFCDINSIDFTIDVGKIENLITEKTSAILATHVYGNICDVNSIEKIAQKYNLKVVYDAAHAFGVTYNNKSIATFGDISMFSLHATKVFNTIEGGITTFRDKKELELVSYLINFGFTGQETIDYIGTNARMNEFEAAMGICNLRHIEDEISIRKVAADRYFEHLDNINGIKLIKPQKNVKQNYSYFPILFDGYKDNRNVIAERLKENNIYARKYFYPITSDAGCYKDSYDSSTTPLAKYFSNRILTLPLYAGLDLNDIDRICKIILKS